MSVQSLNDKLPMEPDEPAGADAVCALADKLARAVPGPLSRLVVRAGNASVELEWAVATTTVPVTTVAGASVTAPAEGGTASEPAADPAMDLGQSGLHELGAPLVGTFYRSPEPGAPPFVNPGDLVSPGQQVAIIEAMKMLISVTAEEHARVAEVLVADGCPVEFGQPLMLLEPAA